MSIIKENKESWQSGTAKTITFIVTKDCQLACKYCYLVGKNETERMSFDIAQKTIDYVLSHKECQIEDEEFDEFCDKLIKKLDKLKEEF